MGLNYFLKLQRNINTNIYILWHSNAQQHNDYDNNYVTNDDNHNGNSHTIDKHDDEDNTIRAIQ